MKKSPFEGFSQLNLEGRWEALKNHADLNKNDFETLCGKKGLDMALSNHLIENTIGLFSLPLGVAPHFLIDGKDYFIPMAIEETSVVAGVSGAAKTIRQSGGFETRMLGNLSIGQIQFPTLQDSNRFTEKINKQKNNIIQKANELIPNLVKRGGGVENIETRLMTRPDKKSMGVLHLLFNTCDAMGANLITQTCEGLKPYLEKLTQEKVGLCILSNLVDSKLVEATCSIQHLDSSLAQSIEEATLFANLDPYRAATHNKGIMNGIDALLIATGNDWRAVEAGAHAYASLVSQYRPLSEWKYENGTLQGKLKLPLSVGIVGGIAQTHPTVKTCLKIMNVTSSEHLARICTAVGLAQNFAALRALCKEGISFGHMKLHASNLALAAGATHEEVPLVQEELRKHKPMTLSLAKEILEKIRAR